MQINTFRIDATDPAGLDGALRAALAEAGPADFIALHSNAALDQAALQALLSAHAPGCAIHGATSCLGTMTETGHQTDGPAGLGLFVLRDPDGDYGSAMEPLADAPEDAAERATQRALIAADRPGELPELVWLSATPGQEERILQGIQRVLGTGVPIIGGSAADNDVTGQWAVFGPEGVDTSAVTVSVLFPSRPVSFAYQNGYAPTAETGIVTRATGRLLQEIDHRPAADVYRAWSRDAVIPATLDGPRGILSDSTLWPLGRPLTQLGEVPYFLLAHPATVHPDGALEMFADVAEGETLTQMQGDRDILAARAGRVAGLAREAGAIAPDAIAGALMVYCGGCMLAVRDRMDRVVTGVTEELPGVPFLGVFTFGEQGNILNVGNRHGNLMISCILFRK